MINENELKHAAGLIRWKITALIKAYGGRETPAGDFLTDELMRALEDAHDLVLEADNIYAIGYPLRRLELQLEYLAETFVVLESTCNEIKGDCEKLEAKVEKEIERHERSESV